MKKHVWMKASTGRKVSVIPINLIGYLGDGWSLLESIVVYDKSREEKRVIGVNDGQALLAASRSEPSRYEPLGAYETPDDLAVGSGIGKTTIGQGITEIISADEDGSGSKASPKADKKTKDAKNPLA